MPAERAAAILKSSQSLVVQYGQDGYVVNNGAIGPEVEYSIPIGTRLQRIGPLNGKYVSFSGTSAEKLSLPPANVGGITLYEVTRTMPSMAGQVAPAYGQPGGGYQMRLGTRDSPMSVADAIEGGYLGVFGQ
jgi:filamentous hemagglutinin